MLKHLKKRYGFNRYGKLIQYIKLKFLPLIAATLSRVP